MDRLMVVWGVPLFNVLCANFYELRFKTLDREDTWKYVYFPLRLTRDETPNPKIVNKIRLFSLKLKLRKYLKVLLIFLLGSLGQWGSSSHYKEWCWCWLQRFSLLNYPLRFRLPKFLVAFLGLFASEFGS